MTLIPIPDHDPSDLTIPATVELLWGWCGPAIGDDGEPFAWMHETSVPQGEGWEHNEPATRDDIAVAIRESSISLDLARPEVMYRVADVMASRPELVQVGKLRRVLHTPGEVAAHLHGSSPDHLRAVWRVREQLREGVK